MKLIGSSRVSTDRKITITKDVSKKLNIERGDIVGFYEDGDNIVIKKAHLKPDT